MSNKKTNYYQDAVAQKRPIQNAFGFMFDRALEGIVRGDSSSRSKIITYRKSREDFLQDVVKQLVDARHKAGMTQEMLNDALGIADRLVNKYECGIKSPSGFILYCWADALGCDVKIERRDGQ